MYRLYQVLKKFRYRSVSNKTWYRTSTSRNTVHKKRLSRKWAFRPKMEHCDYGVPKCECIATSRLEHCDCVIQTEWHSDHIPFLYKSTDCHKLWNRVIFTFQSEGCKCNGWKNPNPLPSTPNPVDLTHSLASPTDACRSCSHTLSKINTVTIVYIHLYKHQWKFICFECNQPITDNSNGDLT